MKKWTANSIRIRILEVLKSYPHSISGSTIHNHMPSCPKRLLWTQLNKLTTNEDVQVSANQPVQYSVNTNRDNNRILSSLWRSEHPCCQEARAHFHRAALTRNY